MRTVYAFLADANKMEFKHSLLENIRDGIYKIAQLKIYLDLNS
jgi:hypothetical protein